ncbi:MAG: hypothetical protein IJ493_05525 [Clostridia bacterium]|nr:hypothetical protein [Clostridia bacterium]
MKKATIIASAALSALLLTSMSVLVRGDELIYDSQNDPLVSLSYINEVLIPSLDEKYTAQLNEAEKKLAEYETLMKEYQITLDKQTEALLSANAEIAALKQELAALSESNDSDGYQVVYLKKGAKLLAETPCEIILRSGTAIAVSITSNGLNDMTNGSELNNADEIPQYHCLLVPRGNDGRGIQITSEDAYIMVRGAYSIVN